MSVNISDLEVGDEVRYQPDHFDNNKWENGRIKEIRQDTPDAVWVVYNCANDWDKFINYTSAKTMLSDLHLGWKEPEKPDLIMERVMFCKLVGHSNLSKATYKKTRSTFCPYCASLIDFFNKERQWKPYPPGLFLYEYMETTDYENYTHSQT